MSDFNHYDTLKVSNNASLAEIKQAYRRLVKIFHPDSNQEITDNEQIIRVNAAYEVLSGGKSRFNYDEKLRHSQQKFHQVRQKRARMVTFSL